MELRAGSLGKRWRGLNRCLKAESYEVVPSMSLEELLLAAESIASSR